MEFKIGAVSKMTGLSPSGIRFLEEQGLPFRTAPENLRWQSGWGVAMAALDKRPGTADELLPVYLRLSQAERERQERLAGQGG